VAKPIAKNLAAKAKDSRIFRHEIKINSKSLSWNEIKTGNEKSSALYQPVPVR
jgi:hypothetical protein